MAVVGYENIFKIGRINSSQIRNIYVESIYIMIMYTVYTVKGTRFFIFFCLFMGIVPLDSIYESDKNHTIDINILFIFVLGLV